MGYNLYIGWVIVDKSVEKWITFRTFSGNNPICGYFSERSERVNVIWFYW